MCIIAIKKANHPLPDGKIMETMFKNNSDGAGFCYTQNGEVIIQKGYMTYEAFSEALKQVSEKIDTYTTPMIFHFRISTHGGINPALCHPFPISHKSSVLKHLTASTRLAIVHNGVIPIRTKKGLSDTIIYITERLAKRYKWNKEFYKSKKQRKAILTEIGNSKLAFLDSEGNIYTIGEFIEDGGIMYSNESYKQRSFSFNFWHDYTDFTKLMPLDDGYIVTENDMIDVEDGSYFIGKGGKLYEYDYYFDVATEIKGSAYKPSGFSATYDEDKSIWISVLM